MMFSSCGVTECQTDQVSTHEKRERKQLKQQKTKAQKHKRRREECLINMRGGGSGGLLGQVGLAQRREEGHERHLEPLAADPAPARRLRSVVHHLHQLSD